MALSVTLALSLAKRYVLFLGVNPEQVARLQKEFSIYMVGSSRISIAGISRDNVDYLAKSIAKVL